MIPHDKHQTEPLRCHVAASHFCQVITSSPETIPFVLRLLPFLCFVFFFLLGSWEETAARRAEGAVTENREESK